MVSACLGTYCFWVSFFFFFKEHGWVGIFGCWGED